MMRSKVLPTLFPALVALALAVHAPAAWGATVKQVRVGDHADFTRVVVELDGPAAYAVSQRSVGGVAELVLGLNATTTTRVVSSHSRLVESVQLRRLPRGAEARIALRAGAVDVKEMVLKNPSRIVLDLSPSKAAAVAPTPAPSPTRTTSTASAPTPERTTSPTSTPSAPPPTRTALAPPPPKVAAATTPETASAAAKDEPTAMAKASAAASEEPSESDEAMETAEEPEAGPAVAMAPKPTPKPTAKPKTAARPEPAPMEEPGLIERLASGEPTLGLTFALGGVAFLLAAFLLLRRRSRRIAQEAAAAPWPPPGAEERPEFAASRAGGDEEDEEHEPLVPMNEANAPLFAATERDDDEGDEPVVELPEAPVDAEPEVVAKSDSPAVEELERRIERLEARLADSLDARERLERQLAAHTEELRVQRAAIARTQRAVRAAVRGPDAPEQPAAQRVPNQVPSPSADPKPGEGGG